LNFDFSLTLTLSSSQRGEKTMSDDWASRAAGQLKREEEAREHREKFALMRDFKLRNQGADFWRELVNAIEQRVLDLNSRLTEGADFKKPYRIEKRGGTYVVIDKPPSMGKELVVEYKENAHCVNFSVRGTDHDNSGTYVIDVDESGNFFFKRLDDRLAASQVAEVLLDNFLFQK
jgi:hypothetical protein